MVDSTTFDLYSPTADSLAIEPHHRLVIVHVVALQVAFERRILKPVFHLIGYRLWV
jgi:hypothetical protein